MFKQITEERIASERQLAAKYPWFNFFYNWFIAVLAVGLAIVMISWGVDVWEARVQEKQHIAEETARREEEKAAEELRQQQLEEERKAEAAQMERWSVAGAKMLWGIRNFRDKYHYTATDLETYLRCAWNRYLNGNKLTDIETIIFKKDQFTGCYTTGAAPDRDKEFARRCFEKFKAEETPECDPTYTFAELTDRGIYLTKTFNADGYEMRWRAS